MEFPELGLHCSLPTCKQYDMLPIKCDACHKDFCKNHSEYSKHNCQPALKRDVKVTVCPMCNKPVPVPKGKNVDEEVSRHMDRNCRPDPAKKEAFAYRCSVRKCKQKEMMEVKCGKCHQNYCIRHRHPQDHDCSGPPPTSSKTGWGSRMLGATGGASTSRASNRPSSSKAPSSGMRSRPQQTLMSTMGSELNRLREERKNSGGRQRQAQATNQSELDRRIALQLAKEHEKAQVEKDLELALRLEREEAANRRREAEKDESSTCTII